MKKFWQWVELLFIGYLILFIFPKIWWSNEINYEEQTDKFHQRLLDILNETIDPNVLIDPNKPYDPNKRKELLKDLAREVGAGFERFEIAAVIRYKEEDATVTETRHNTISESELVQNINNALQTRMIIAATKSSTKSYIISFAAVIAAVISASVALKSANKNKSTSF